MAPSSNRYADDDDGDDDFDMDEWMELTEAEQDAEVESSMRQFEESWNRLTPLQQYRIRRRNALRGCLSMRIMRQQMGCHDMFTRYLRERQINLVQLRMERAGVTPGRA